MAVVVKTVLASHFGVGEFTTHFRTYFSGWIELDPFVPRKCPSKNRGAEAASMLERGLFGNSAPSVPRCFLSCSVAPILVPLFLVAARLPH